MKTDTEWKRKYNSLKEFITSNPEIYLGTNEVSIPGHLRDEFYKQFDDVRRLFIQSLKSSYDFEDLQTLGKYYVETENRLSETLGLKHMDLPVDLESFLHNPEKGMMRMLYNRLFELLQGKITEDDFKKTAEDDLKSRVVEMFRLGYEQWAAVSILLLLEPDEIHGVTLDDDYNPNLSKLDQITFGKQDHHASKRIPEFIIHSKRLDKYVAVKMPLATSVDFYILPTEIPTKRILRDRTGDTSQVLGARMLFLAVVPDLEKLPVFADLHERTICGPDLTIEFLTGHELSDPSALQKTQTHVEIMQPRLGGNIVLVDGNPDTAPDKGETGMDIFSVRLDQSKLQPIIDRLVQ